MSTESLEQSATAPAAAQTAGSEGIEVERFEGLDRIEARSLYEMHLSAEQFGEAVEVARYALELTEREFGPRSVELAPELNNLGSALLKASQPEQALIHFERSAALVQDQRGLFNEGLLAPIMGQGYAQQQIGEHEAAVDSFRRGQHIVHRNDGVLGLDQLAAVEAMANSLIALDEREKAERVRLLGLKIYRRKFGRDDPRITEGLYSLARWYRSQGDVRQAMALYARGLELERNAGSSEIEMLPGLQGLAEGYSRRPGSSALQSALQVQQEIVRVVDTMPVDRQRVVAHLHLGDLWLRAAELGNAQAAYRNAQALAAEDGQNDWSGLFTTPQMIYPGPNLDFHASKMEEQPYYDFNATIGADGVPREVSVVASNTRGQTRSAAVQAFRRARFRPRMENSQPVATEDYTFRRIYPLIVRRPQAGSGIRF